MNRTLVVSKYIGSGLLLGSVFWVFLLVDVAQRVQAVSQNQYAVKAGPLLLDHIIERHANTGGFTLSITFESGLIWYLFAWVLIGAAVGYIRNYRKYV